MNKEKYDIVYLTNTPSFYKLNLMEEVAKLRRVMLVFYGYGAEAVNTAIESRHWSFDYRFINQGDANARSKWRTFRSLLRLMRGVEARRVLFAGWLAPEYNLYSFLSPKRKNAVICESSILDVSFAGLKGWVKRRIIGRMSAALPSGRPHDELFESIGFAGPRHITGSVGIINKSEVGRPKALARQKADGSLRCLYVGRLIEVKNLRLLIEAFNQSGRQLTIVGTGEMEQELKAMAGSNVEFLGFIDNERLGDIYRSHDLFILPSSYEPWGLVVEEAIYWGLPTLVSDRVGAGPDMVVELATGEIFDHTSAADLNLKIDAIEADYARYKSAVEAVDFDGRDRRQIEAYLSL